MLYSTGTATFTTGSTAVTGTGTAWNASMVGAAIERNGLTKFIASVTSPTALTLSSAAPSGMNGTGAYAIALNLANSATGGEVLPKVNDMLDRHVAIMGAPLDALIASSSFSQGLLDNTDQLAWQADLGIQSNNTTWKSTINSSLPQRLQASASSSAITGSIDVVTGSGIWGALSSASPLPVSGLFGIIEMFDWGGGQWKQIFHTFVAGQGDTSYRRYRRSNGTITNFEQCLETFGEADARYVQMVGSTITGVLNFKASSTLGSVEILTGTTSGVGNITFKTADGTRRGIIGLNSGTNIWLYSENGWGYAFQVNPLVNTFPMHHDGRANRAPAFTVSTVPSASVSGAGAEIYISNEAGGAVMAFSDGTNWRRCTDRAIIS